jgi:hypothetical protein
MPVALEFLSAIIFIRKLVYHVSQSLICSLTNSQLTNCIPDVTICLMLRYEQILCITPFMSSGALSDPMDSGTPRSNIITYFSILCLDRRHIPFRCFTGICQYEKAP